jgi:WD40 repeat protein
MRAHARVGVALACAAAALAALPFAARSAEPADTPPGLSIVWRMPGRKVERGATGGALSAFSPDGRYVAIHDSRRVRIVDARSGKPVRDFSLDPSSIEPFSLAVSSTGDVALGLMGNAEVFRAGKDPVRHWCVGACGAITSVAFSPDERFLAFQGTRGLPEWRSGLGGVVSVVDLERGEPVSLDAVASIAQVGFSPDGKTFCAMSVTQLDERQSFGVRIWSTGDWSLTHNIVGSKRTMRRVAPLGSVPYAGVSMNKGHIEARDLATDRVLWSVPLVPPNVDGAPGAPESVNLDLVEISPTADFVLSYEAPKDYDVTGLTRGVIAIRRADDGELEALYDAPRVSALTIAPDGKTFAYSTATGQTYTAVARVPL